MRSGDPAGGQAPAQRTGGRRVRIGRLWIDAVTFEGALERIAGLVAARQGAAVFTPNVDHVVTAEDDPDFRTAYAAASLSLPDGQPLVWASRLLGTPVPEKVSGSDLVLPLLRRAAGAGWRVYLLGGVEGAAEAARARMARELGVEIVGVDAPRISADGGEDEAAVLARLRRARPDLVLVGLGSPKQERFIHRSLPGIAPAVAVGVGASIDFLAGRVRRAPPWISRAGLEWLFRLSLEPRRLAHRYLVKDPRFLAVLARTAREPATARTEIIPDQGRPAGVGFGVASSSSET
jgi:N-acetylglucosaminyldiphosphoundecaprenol N-acetyl-beta-D-mannosaminyltransferase